MADALDDPALDLARRAERVDHAADVVDRRDPVDRDLAGLDVDRDLGDVDAEREHLHARSGSGRARPCRGSARPRAADDRPALAARDDHAARSVASVVALRASSRICRFASAAAARTAGPHRRRRRRAARERCVRPARRVAGRHGHVLERDPELLGRDLRERRLRAGADVLHRGDDGRAAVGADAHPRVARRAAAAVPDLRRHPDAALDRRRSSARAPRAAAPSAARRGGSTRAGSCRCTGGRPAGRTRRGSRRRSSSGSRSSFAASSSSRHSSPNVPSTNPGARNGFIGGLLIFAPRVVVLTFGHA